MEEFFYSPGFAGFPLECHRHMVHDKRRMRAFVRALKAAIRPGDVVLDVGSGTGVLSFLAHRFGASKVIGLERSDIVETARFTKERNYPDAPIEFLRVDALTGELPRIQVDVIVCELLGNFGIDEGIVPLLRRVRRLLRPDGRLVPASVELMLSPIQSTKVHDQLNGWQRQFHRVDLSPFQTLAYDRVYLLEDDQPTLLAKPQSLTTFPLGSAGSIPSPMTAAFRASRAGTLHGFAGWFVADLGNGQFLSTSPRRRSTHWGQVFFPSGAPRPLRRGEQLRFTLRLRGSNRHRHWSWSGSIDRRNGEQGASETFAHQAIGLA